MSVSILDQYLRVVPTLGVQASQTQFVNNLRAGFASSAATDKSHLNLFSVDGSVDAAVNIVAKSGTRMYAGAGQNASDYAVEGTVASKQYGEFQIDGAVATLHVPELDNSILRLGAAGAANAATMSYLTLTNESGLDGNFQKVSTTANYLELTSNTAANTVVIAGMNGLRVEQSGTDALVSARSGDLMLEAAAGSMLHATANAGIQLMTDAGDISISAPAGDASIGVRDLLSLQSTQGDVTVGALLGNVSLSATQDLTATANVVSLDAASLLEFSSTLDIALTAGRDLLQTAGANAVFSVTGALRANAASVTVGSTGAIDLDADIDVLISASRDIRETAGNAVSVTAEVGPLDLTALANSMSLSASTGTITGTAQNLSWVSMDSGSPFYVTQKAATLLVNAQSLPGAVSSNTAFYVSGDSVFYGNVDIKGEINRVVTNEVVLEVRDKIITVANSDMDANNVISDYDQHDAGIQLKTPNAVGQEDHSKYIKWYSSGTGASDAGYLAAMNIMDTNSDGSRWVIRGGDLWLERTVTDSSNTTRNVAFGFVITKDLRLALVRRQGTYDVATEQGPANAATNFEPMQFFGTPVLATE